MHPTFILLHGHIRRCVSPCRLYNLRLALNCLFHTFRTSLVLSAFCVDFKVYLSYGLHDHDPLVCVICSYVTT